MVNNVAAVKLIYWKNKKFLRIFTVIFYNPEHRNMISWQTFGNAVYLKTSRIVSYVIKKGVVANYHRKYLKHLRSHLISKHTFQLLCWENSWDHLIWLSKRYWWCNEGRKDYSAGIRERGDVNILSGKVAYNRIEFYFVSHKKNLWNFL